MNAELLERIEACKDDVKLSTWEIDFLEGIFEAVLDGRSLTAKQEDILERIEEKIA